MADPTLVKGPRKCKQLQMMKIKSLPFSFLLQGQTDNHCLCVDLQPCLEALLSSMVLACYTEGKLAPGCPAGGNVTTTAITKYLYQQPALQKAYTMHISKQTKSHLHQAS